MQSSLRGTGNGSSRDVRLLQGACHLICGAVSSNELELQVPGRLYGSADLIDAGNRPHFASRNTESVARPLAYSVPERKTNGTGTAVQGKVAEHSVVPLEPAVSFGSGEEVGSEPAGEFDFVGAVESPSAPRIFR